MMTTIGEFLLGVFLTWNSVPVSCGFYNVELYDAYIYGSNDASEGYRLIPMRIHSYNLLPNKPEIGCAIAWRITAVRNGEPLSADCQIKYLADGISWEGM